MSQLFRCRLAGLALSVFTLIGLGDLATADIVAFGNLDPEPPVSEGTISGELVIGSGETEGFDFGLLSIFEGSFLRNDDATIGDPDDGLGIVEVFGFDSRWETADELIVGDNGRGSLDIFDEASVKVEDDMFIGRGAAQEIGGLTLPGRGEVNLFGRHSRLFVDDDLEVGGGGFGTLDVSDRAFLSSGDTWIGRERDSEGLAIFAGFRTLWLNERAIEIGDSGQGELRILDGARAEQTAVIIADGTSGTGRLIVEGADAELWHTNRLTVGNSGTAEMFVRAGGLVRSGSAIIGNNLTSRGEATVEGIDSRWQIEDTLAVGNEQLGFARLTVGEGGFVSADDGVSVGTTGRIHLAAGQLQTLLVSNGGEIDGYGLIDADVDNFLDASIHVAEDRALRITGTTSNSGLIASIDGELIFNQSVSNTAAGQIAFRDGIARFDGGLTNEGQVSISFGESDIFGPVTNAATGTILVAGEEGATFYDDVVNEGTIEVLAGASAIFVQDLSLSQGASLQLGLSGEEFEEETSLMNIGGGLNLGGGLDVDLAPGLVPAEGDIYPLLSAAGGIAGDFDALSLPNLDSGLGWLMLSDATDLWLAVVEASLPGDYSGNGVVEQADLDLVLLNWGQPASPAPAGWVQNLPTGTIDQNELDGILLNWGASATPATTAVQSTAVPEPAAWLLLVLGIIAWAGSKRSSVG